MKSSIRFVVFELLLSYKSLDLYRDVTELYNHDGGDYKGGNDDDRLLTTIPHFLFVPLSLVAASAMTAVMNDRFGYGHAHYDII